MISFTQLLVPSRLWRTALEATRHLLLLARSRFDDHQGWGQKLSSIRLRGCSALPRPLRLRRERCSTGKGNSHSRRNSHSHTSSHSRKNCRCASVLRRNRMDVFGSRRRGVTSRCSPLLQRQRKSRCERYKAIDVEQKYIITP